MELMSIIQWRKTEMSVGEKIASMKGNKSAQGARMGAFLHGKNR